MTDDGKKNMTPLEKKKELIRKIGIALISVGIIIALWQTKVYNSAQDPATVAMPVLKIGSGIAIFVVGVCVSLWNKYSKAA